MDPASRLRTARGRLFDAASEAARQINVKTPTYLGHENGTRKMSPEQAEFYAAQFGVRVEWLLFDRGPMRDERAGEPEPGPARAAGRALPANPLLSMFRLVYAPDGAIRAQPGAVDAGPFELPPAHATNGYLVELAFVGRPAFEARRVVALPEREGDVFVLVDFLRLPPEMLAIEYAFVMKFGTSDLIEGANAFDRAVIDPTARRDPTEGYYAALLRGQLALIYLRPPRGHEREAFASEQLGVLVWESRYREPSYWEMAEAGRLDQRIVGRAVLLLMAFSEGLTRNFQSVLPKPESFASSSVSTNRLSLGKV